MSRHFATRLTYQTVRGYQGQAQPYQASLLYNEVKDIPKRVIKPSVESSQELLRSLLQGYNPTFQRHPLGMEAEALIKLSPRQQMCYYDGKMFGGYLVLLLDRILADCCRPAFTAYLNTSFAHSVPPDAPIRLCARPEKVEGRKIYLTASIQIPGSKAGDMVDAIKADALFVRPRN
ncbi:hotdog fold domain-containing protein [Aspergillus tanneri]|uniref:Thioesterase domain-containing protein n=1 Tax=Aspergillus tanneri TaxID=1220188 RepID=A0A5M9MSP3_9EURO|nr:uncharacterized protein ATNIH1004_006595 [Aspergillus tanneri]XP_033429007.1 uncharacterized protein ATNIH1004_002317 [Aspergillus tanneri]KAA8647893.1 hypothetical protein ATNIH1004_006595 [Aspergillus tanneri]KAA8649646.1 hypothetical protein ATNIH1004_002317 [Aspergillus tanneri]